MIAFTPRPPGLLVSVRSAAEAEAALRGGADLIDVKEPSRGPLGRADDETIADVVQTVAGRVPVSAAMGEWSRESRPCRVPGVSFAKWGLAGWAQVSGWQEQIFSSMAACSSDCRSVLVAYADCKRAGSPPPEMLCEFAREQRMPAFVIDTYSKDGATILDWISVAGLALLTWQCQNLGIKVALAGSLGREAITGLRDVCPDWFAVRGAACSEGRTSTVDENRVRELKEAISSFQHST
jgi:(5-formylfuran-3-yl)methyl phosphate synthase